MKYVTDKVIKFHLNLVVICEFVEIFGKTGIIKIVDK